ncbi:hypothetical protein IE077_003912, partial [Cardiosporidium cionae]
ELPISFEAFPSTASLLFEEPVLSSSLRGPSIDRSSLDFSLLPTSQLCPLSAFSTPPLSSLTSSPNSHFGVITPSPSPLSLSPGNLPAPPPSQLPSSLLPSSSFTNLASSSVLPLSMGGILGSNLSSTARSPPWSEWLSASSLPPSTAASPPLHATCKLSGLSTLCGLSALNHTVCMIDGKDGCVRRIDPVDYLTEARIERLPTEEGRRQQGWIRPETSSNRIEVVRISQSPLTSILHMEETHSIAVGCFNGAVAIHTPCFKESNVFPEEKMAESRHTRCGILHNSRSIVQDSIISMDVKLCHADTVTCLAYEKNNQLLVSGSSDETVRVWSVSSTGLTATRIFDDHSDELTSVATFANLILSGSGHGLLVLWDTRSPASPVCTGEIPDISVFSTLQCSLSDRSMAAFVFPTIEKGYSRGGRRGGNLGDGTSLPSSLWSAPSFYTPRSNGGMPPPPPGEKWWASSLFAPPPSLPSRNSQETSLRLSFPSQSIPSSSTVVCPLYCWDLRRLASTLPSPLLSPTPLPLPPSVPLSPIQCGLLDPSLQYALLVHAGHSDSPGSLSFMNIHKQTLMKHYPLHTLHSPTLLSVGSAPWTASFTEVPPGLSVKGDMTSLMWKQRAAMERCSYIAVGDKEGYVELVTSL